MFTSIVDINPLHVEKNDTYMEPEISDCKFLANLNRTLSNILVFLQIFHISTSVVDFENIDSICSDRSFKSKVR